MCWHEPRVADGVNEVVEAAAKAIKSNRDKYSRLLLIVIGLLLTATLLTLIANVFWPYTQSDNDSQPKHDLPNKYSQIKPLTQTDAHESHALFSPNTKYLIFNRYAGSCKSHIWARHLASGKESQLTAQPGQFGSVSFTGDGREMIFAANNQCDTQNNIQKNMTEQQNKSIEQTCWSLATLDFSLSLNAPQIPNFRHQCQADRLLTPKALSNHQYAFLQSDGGRYQLMHYNDLNKELRTLYSSESHYIYHFDYDQKHKRFVVISRDDEFNNIVELLDESGQVVSRETIKITPKMSRYQLFAGNFEPQGEYLLAVSNNRLYKIALNGKLQWVQTPTSNLISVTKHSTKHTMLAVQGKKDIDVAQLSLKDKSLAGEKTLVQVESDLNQADLNAIDLNHTALPFLSFARTSAQDRRALYQPNGDRVAFISDRSGSDQLWIWHNGEASQLSFETNQNKIQNYSWSPDGTRLSRASGDKLVIVDLNGRVEYLSTSKPIHSVLSWYKENQFLVLLSDPEPGGLYHLDIKQNKLIAYGVNQVENAWALQNKIIFSNINGEVFTRSIDFDKPETKPLSELNVRAIFMADQIIYGVDKYSFMLNQYNLDGHLIKSMMRLKPTAWKVTGLKDDQLLLSQFIAINQDIVILEE
ncbi:MAG: hypothetical protein COA86_07245 [Kangiella sp.]|nr:MAG: hypothetical protein COA86_07245 [Kangiella sp.]